MVDARPKPQEQRRVGYHWKLRAVMATHNLWKSTELVPLLQSRGINLSESQVYRIVTGTPERIPGRVLAALCDIFDCTPNDLIEPYVELKAARTPDAPRSLDDLPAPDEPLTHRVHLTPLDSDE